MNFLPAASRFFLASLFRAGCFSGLRLVLLLACGMLPLCGLAQSTVTVSGSVAEAGAPIGWANVVLLGAGGKVVAATTTQEDGGFTLAAAPGAYRLRVSFLGFTDWEQALQLEKSVALGTIRLQASPARLGEVTVVGRKNLVDYQADRVVFNVENSVAATGGDAVQALGAAPGVLVQQNGISMLGKGAARVLVDGRLLELSGEELVAYLKSIPASSIKNVEVMANPPARYEAAGAGGLININLKQGAANSWKNTTTLAREQNTYGTYALRNNLLYNRNKLRLAVSAGGKLGHTNVRQTLDTDYSSGPWELRYTGKQQENNASARVSADYDLTPRLALGAQYAGTATAAPSSRDYTTIRILNPAGSPDSLLLNTGTRRVRTTSHAYNAHLVAALDTQQRRLSADIDYFTYHSGTDNQFAAQSFSPALEFQRASLAAHTIAYQQVRNFSAKVDMAHPLRWAELSYGAKISRISSASGLQYYNTLVEMPALDASRSNDFSYRENTQALYVSGTRSLTEKLSLQLGLRLENTRTQGYSATIDQQNTNAYLKLFPTAYLSYKPTASQNIQATYGRRVSRPGFGLLNPFRSYINSTSYSEGNPFLQPAFVDNLDVTYSHHEAWRTNVFCSRTANGFGPVFTSDAATKTLVISRQNYFREYTFGLGETYTASPTAWWQTQNQVYVLGSRTRFVRDIQAQPANTVQLYAATSNTFTLGKSTKLQLDYTYSSPFTKGLYHIGYVSGLNVSIRQSFLQNRLQMSVLLNDAFNTAYLKDYTSTVNGIRQVYSENNSSRFLRLSLTYDFGNSQIKAATRDFGNDDELKRTN